MSPENQENLRSREGDPAELEKMQAAEGQGRGKTREELAAQAEVIKRSGEGVWGRGEETLTKAEGVLDDIADAKFNNTKDFLNAQKIDEQNFVDYLKTQTLDPTITHPTNAQIIQAVKDWQKLQGLKDDGVIGPKTFAKMQAMPDLMVALKKEKPVWARAAEGKDAPEARRYEVLIPKGTEYEFQRPDKQIVKGKFTDENTPAIVLTETDKTYKVQLSDESIVRVPKSQGVVLERSRYAQRTMSTPPVFHGSSGTTSEEKPAIRSAFKEETESGIQQLKKVKKSFNK